MPRKTHTPEEIVATLRQVDVAVAQGRPLAEAIRRIGVSEVTCHRWRNAYGRPKLGQVERLKELEQENARLRKAVSDLTRDKLILRGSLQGWGRSRKRSGGPFQARTISPERRREAVREVRAEFGVSQPRACRVPGQPRSTQRRPLRTAEDGEEDLKRPRWTVFPPKLQVPGRQPRKGRLWLNDGSCIRLRPERANHVWPRDVVEHRTLDGRKVRMLCGVDEFTREALAILVKRRLTSSDVLEVLAEPMLARGTPSHIRSDNGPECAAVAVKAWMGNLGVNTAFIEPGSPVGERPCRELQLEAPRRAARRRDLPRAEGGADPDRRPAAPRQHDPAPLGTGLAAAGTRGRHHPGSGPSAPGPVNRDGNQCNRPPTVKPDP